jgi:anthranilate synthase component II
MRILIIDNFDSFTFNLLHYMEQYCQNVTVLRNNGFDISTLENFDKICLSPGPGLPSEVPALERIIKHLSGRKPILGVCLGHQAIAQSFGGNLINLEEPSHGKPVETIITDRSDYLFNGIPDTFTSGRYHSWVVNKNSLSDEIIITSEDEGGNIMSLRHKFYDIRGVQFHPESVMTDYGKKILQNWVER